ncbi:hypothetical protein [Bosea sp. (in: a-proteobacteria)]|uniref:hypothetical protein n=1 Tax=Bosea sp. (in: a-proteobacteria) TaxID=1871050 RepID=UPI002DDCF0C4|nr:hypothetical protein [Bosea sp. (in: a-proteobacteria)]HEV2508624.1 hypothetical protein [Bosea sp. (in: a-proteobacteria)]
MSRAKSTTEWFIREHSSAAAGLASVGGRYVFELSSPSIKGIFTARFTGVGVGGGLDFTVGSAVFKGADWTKLDTRISFSIDDLDGSEGQIFILSGRFLVGYTHAEVSAWKGKSSTGARQGILFWAAPVSGKVTKRNLRPKAKIGVYGAHLAGTWKVDQ